MPFRFLAPLGALAVCAMLFSACNPAPPAASLGNQDLSLSHMQDLVKGLTVVENAEANNASNLPLLQQINQSFGIGSCLVSPAGARGASAQSLDMQAADCVTLQWLELTAAQRVLSQFGLAPSPRELSQAQKGVAQLVAALRLGPGSLPPFFVGQLSRWYAVTTKLRAFAQAVVTELSDASFYEKFRSAFQRTCFEETDFSSFAQAAAYEVGEKGIHPLSREPVGCGSGFDASSEAGQLALFLYFLPTGGQAPPLPVQAGGPWAVLKVIKRGPAPSLAEVARARSAFNSSMAAQELAGGYAEELLISAVNAAHPYVNPSLGSLIRIGGASEICAPPPAKAVVASAPLRNPEAAAEQGELFYCPRNV